MFRIELVLIIVFIFALSFTVFSQKNDWKQYSSSLAGIKVNYPSNWTSTEMAYSQVWHIGFLSPGIRDDDVWEHSGIRICIQPKGHTTTSSDGKSKCRQRDDHLSDYAKNKIVSEEDLKINGLQIHKKITEDKYRPTDTYIYATFSSKNREFLISGFFPRRFDLDKYIPVFDQMLQTITILNEKQTLTYRNEKYDFALTYPTSWNSCPISANSQNKDEEEFLLLVPFGKSCNGGNYISFSRMTKFSNEKNNRDLKEFLQNKEFSKIIPNLEFGNIHSAMGEKLDGKYLKRERFFYTNYPQTYELLKISEMYENEQPTYKKEADEILTTAQRFLKVG